VKASASWRKYQWRRQQQISETTRSIDSIAAKRHRRPAWRRRRNIGGSGSGVTAMAIENGVSNISVVWRHQYQQRGA